MFDNTIQQPDAMVDWTSPLNRDYGPNRGLVMRLLTLAQGGNRWRDIADGNHGTFVNGPKWSTSRIGSFGGLSFDGTNDYVQVSGLSSGSGTTWSTWVNLRTSLSSGPMLMSYVSSGFWELRYDSSAMHPAIYWGGQYLISPTAVSLGQWNQIGITLTPAGVLVLYVNGIAKVQSTGTPKSIPTIDIGRRLGNSAYTVDGLMDDVCIWNRALSASEYKEFFNDSVNGYPESLNWTQSYRLSDVIGGGGGGGFQAYWARRQSQFIGGGLI